MLETSIRARIRGMLEVGEISCDAPDGTWAGRGVGVRCIACEGPIAPTQVEYEVEYTGRVYRLHRGLSRMLSDLARGV